MNNNMNVTILKKDDNYNFLGYSGNVGTQLIENVNLVYSYLLDDNNEFIFFDFHTNNKVASKEFYDEINFELELKNKELIQLKGEYIYGSSSHSVCFGHFQDVIQRIYYTIDTIGIKPILCDEGFFSEFIDLLGYEKKSINLFSNNYYIEKLYHSYIPIRRSFWIKEYLDRFRNTIFNFNIDENYDNPIFLTRIKKPVYGTYHKQIFFQRYLKNNDQIKKLFDELNIDTYENLSIKDRISYFRNRKKVIALLGSGIYNLIFTLKCHVIIIRTPVWDDYTFIDFLEKCGHTYEIIDDVCDNRGNYYMSEKMVELLINKLDL